MCYLAAWLKQYYSYILRGLYSTSKSTLEYLDCRYNYDQPFIVFRALLCSYEEKGRGEEIDSYNDALYKAYNIF